MQSLDAITASLVAVFLAEMGDKTQFLALVLGARFRAPLPVITGITLATAVNHAAAAGPLALVGGRKRGHSLPQPLLNPQFQ